MNEKEAGMAHLRTIQFLQQIDAKNIHPAATGSGIGTHDLLTTFFLL